jgi:hypothetical protein
MISVILNVYRRPHSLEKQIEAIKSQTIKVDPSNIHVWYNDPVDNSILQTYPKDEGIKTYKCNYNTKFFGRFLLPHICHTPYIAMFDDDIIPGNMWLENCVDTMKTHEGILGGSGVILNSEKAYAPNRKVGWNGIKNTAPTEVDLVGHAWFFKQEHAKFMWQETPPSFDNGEDIHFSYVAQKNGVKTFVPPTPQHGEPLWCNSSKKDGNMGNDKAASWRHNPNHFAERNEIVRKLVAKGWKTLK